MSDNTKNNFEESIERLEKQVADIKGDITQLFDRLADLAEDVDELKKS